MSEYGSKITYFVFILSIIWIIALGHSFAQTRVRLATLAPQGTVYHQALEKMGEQWRKAPGGGVQLTIYPNGTIGDEKGTVQRMRINQVQAALLTTIGMAEIDPSVTALQNMPMVFRSMDEVAYVREKLRPKIEKRLEERGFVVLAWGETGWVRFFSKKPALHPDDFKGMRVFVTAGDTEQINLMTAIGYHPVPLDWTNVLTGLQTGLIDVVPTAPMVSLGAQYFTVANYMLDVKWAPLGGGLIITKRTWDALSPDAREYLRKTAIEATEEISRRGRENEEQSIDAMKKRGLHVTTLTPQAVVEWQNLAEKMYPQIRGKMVPADLFDEVQTLLAERRKMNGTAKAQVAK
jgi:TRAP-type transport system periplasmic protein